MREKMTSKCEKITVVRFAQLNFGILHSEIYPLRREESEHDRAPQQTFSKKTTN